MCTNFAISPSILKMVDEFWKSQDPAFSILDV